MTSEEAMQLFTSLLAILALAGAVLILVLRLLARSVPAAADLLDSIGSISLWLAFVVAATATGGSLWFSEVANYVPCRFCWFQRIFMFPQTIVLLVAAIRKDRAVKYTAVPLSLIGASISVYHFGLEQGWFEESTKCDPAVPCSAPWFEQWGFFTLAVMAFCGFMAIIALTTCPEPRPYADDVDGPDTDAEAELRSDPQSLSVHPQEN